MRSSRPAGALSKSASTVRRPNWMLTQTTTTETPSAASASAARKPEFRREQADDHDGGAPDVGLEMQSVGLERLAIVLFGGRREHARARRVDRDRDHHHGERPEGDFDFRLMRHQAVDRLSHDPNAGAPAAAAFRKARTDSRFCRDRTGACGRAAGRRIARRSRSSAPPPGRARNAPLRPEFPRLPVRTPTMTLKAVSPTAATSEVDAAHRFSCCSLTHHRPRFAARSLSAQSRAAAVSPRAPRHRISSTKPAHGRPPPPRHKGTPGN